MDMDTSQSKMTNLEFLKSLKTGEEVYIFIKQCNYGCIQQGSIATQIWKEHCLSEEYRGERGCRKCMIEFWDREVEQ